MKLKREIDTWAVRMEHWNPPGVPRSWSFIGVFYEAPNTSMATGVRTRTFNTREGARAFCKRHTSGKFVPVKVKITIEEI